MYLNSFNSSFDKVFSVWFKQNILMNITIVFEKIIFSITDCKNRGVCAAGRTIDHSIISVQWYNAFGELSQRFVLHVWKRLEVLVSSPAGLFSLWPQFVFSDSFLKVYGWKTLNPMEEQQTGKRCFFIFMSYVLRVVQCVSSSGPSRLDVPRPWTPLLDTESDWWALNARRRASWSLKVSRAGATCGGGERR